MSEQNEDGNPAERALPMKRGGIPRTIRDARTEGSRGREGRQLETARIAAGRKGKPDFAEASSDLQVSGAEQDASIPKGAASSKALQSLPLGSEQDSTKSPPESRHPKTGAGSKVPFEGGLRVTASAQDRIEERVSLFERASGWTGRVHVAVAILFLLGFYLAYQVGRGRGEDAAAREIASSIAQAPPAPSEREREEVRQRLDQALALTRSGDAEGGWNVIRGIARSYSHMPSLAYAEALVALQAQQVSEALDLTRISISRKERVAESLALQAAINASTPGSSGAVQEDLLWKAVDADPMNPYPLIELATYYGVHGEDQKAESLIQSAKSRLLPVDSHAVVDASLGIFKFKRTPSDVLPQDAGPTGLAEKDFPNAYAAMRRGDFQAAASILESSRRTVSPEIFDYLLNASPIRDFALEPKITRFY